MTAEAIRVYSQAEVRVERNSNRKLTSSESRRDVCKPVARSITGRLEVTIKLLHDRQIFASRSSLTKVRVRLTYYQIRR